MVVLVLLGLTACSALQSAPSANRTTILVAGLERSDAQGRRLAEAMVRGLRAELAPYRDVSVRTLGRTVTQAEGSTVARMEGAQRKAAMVLWGAYDAGQSPPLLRLHVELLHPPQGVPAPELSASLPLEAAASPDLVVLRRLILALVRYVSEDWNGVLETCGAVVLQSVEQPPESALALTFMLSADAHYAKADLERSAAGYDQAIVFAPKWPVVYVKRGIASTSKGDYDGATAALDKAISLDPGLTEAYYYSGNAFLAKGELERAVADFNQAIAKRPGFAEALCNRGLAFASNGNYAQAIEDLTKAVAAKPDFARAYALRGSAHYALGEFDQAIGDYDRAIALKPDFAEAYFNRGTTYEAKGEAEKAIADYRRFLELSTDPSWRDKALQKLKELGAQ
jgi:tetratricopeptide (TPR) repeat protein